MRIFDVEPTYWGLNGNKVLWEHLRCLSDSNYRTCIFDIESYIEAFIFSRTIKLSDNIGELLDNGIVGRAKIVDYIWWYNFAIPLLQDRLQSSETADYWRHSLIEEVIA